MVNLVWKEECILASSGFRATKGGTSKTGTFGKGEFSTVDGFGLADSNKLNWIASRALAALDGSEESSKEFSIPRLISWSNGLSLT